MLKFQLAHISDLHFATSEGRGNKWAAGRYVEAILNFRSLHSPSSFSASKAIILADHLIDLNGEIDALVISGDIATTGDFEDLLAARQWVDGSASSRHVTMPTKVSEKKQITRRFVEAGPLVMLPGNHDRFVVNAKNKPRSSEFEKVFGSDWNLGAVSGNQHGQDIREFTIAREEGRLTVLCADFTLRAMADQDCSWGYLGQGKAYSDITKDLVNATKKVRQQGDNHAVMWVVHYPPLFEYSDKDLRMRLILESEFLAAADANAIRILLCGHSHVSKIYQPKGSKVCVICAGTAIAFGKENEAHSFHTIEIETNLSSITNAQVKNWRYDVDRASFEPDEEVSIAFN